MKDGTFTLKTIDGDRAVVAYASEAIQSFVLSLPMRFDGEGYLLYSDRNVIRMFQHGDSDVVVKRFKRNGLVKKVIYTFFRKTKARRAYFNGVELLRRGISTPKPVAFMETYRHGLLRDCFYLCDVDNDTPIASAFDHDDWDRPLASAFGRFVALLQSRGVIDNDLNQTNVLFHGEEGNYHFSLIDINRMRFFPQGADILLHDRLENLTRFTGRYDLFEYVVREFALACGLDADKTAEEGLKIKTAHDQNRRRRKQFTGFFKKLFRLSD